MRKVTLQIMLALSIGLTTTVQARVSELLTEFLSRNVNIRKNQNQVDLSKLEFRGLKAGKSWVLEGSTGYAKDKLAGNGLYNQASQDRVSLKLKKAFEWGGSLNFENNLIDNDVRRNQAEAELLGTQNKFYEFQHIVQYKQELGKNFFGREFRSELKIAKLNAKLAAISLKKVDQDLLLDFYSQYMKAKLNKTLIQLQKSALKRGKRLRRIIRGWVKDGLREKVDLYRAEILVRSQQENISKSKQEYESSLEELGKRLHRNVGDKEIVAYSIKKFKSKNAVGGQLDKNLETKRLDRNIALVKERLRKAKMGFIPQILFSGSYKTNSNEGNWQDAMNRGKLGEKNNEIQVGLTVSVPLFNKPAKVARAKERIELLNAEMERREHQKNIAQTERSLNNKIGLLKKNIGSSMERKNYAGKSLKEANRLYELGRVNLDSVLLSEEELIKTEISSVNYLTNLDVNKALKATLYGALKNYLLGIEEG